MVNNCCFFDTSMDKDEEGKEMNHKTEDKWSTKEESGNCSECLWNTKTWYKSSWNMQNLPIGKANKNYAYCTIDNYDKNS